MSLRRSYIVSIVCIGLFALPYNVEAQGVSRPADTIYAAGPEARDMDKIIDLRTQLKRQNATYSPPLPLQNQLLRFLEKEKLTLSDEALYWAHLVMDASKLFDENISFRDTIIVSHLFMPLVFRGDIIPDHLVLYDRDILKPGYSFTPWYQPDTTLFSDFIRRDGAEKRLLRYVEDNHPDYFRYSKRDLPDDLIRITSIRTPVYEEVPLKISSEVVQNELEAPQKFIPDRLYWVSAFESAVQFSQNYVSPNWHKGGSSNLNIFTKNYLKYDYSRDKVQFTNEVEIKASIYNAPNDTINSYKIGDDLFRLHSNYGYKAFNMWYYTFDAEFKTQLFSNYQENKRIKQAALLSPYAFNVGIGMKYDLNKSFQTRNKNLKMSINLAPFSYTYMKSIDEEIDLARHGFQKKKETDEYNNTLSRFGSTIRTDMTMNFNRNISWQSRFYFFTTYELSQFEFENTLVLAITRHFSTRIYAHLRFDDSVTKKEDFDSYFQLNELLSFGFNYKW
ncbi:MAG: DUF3078 domain-containing protein [Tannerellaceae bacterium]|jgi:hypothetical protein|nr:DUF3078 domain-containing protein [Tannerellaceae bacterium]